MWIPVRSWIDDPWEINEIMKPAIPVPLMKI